MNYLRNYCIGLLAVVLLFFSCINASAQLVIDNTVNASNAVQNVLLGGGITANNITFQGVDEQIGSFTCNNCGLGIGNGVVMATGNVDTAPGPNNQPDASGDPPIDSDAVSDSDLEQLSGMSLNNTAVLEFDFTPTGDSLFFNYVFASDEYPEYVNSVNDAFGFFISGPGISGPYSNNAESIALVPNSSTPITINTVNDGLNSAYYVDNSDEFNPPYNVQADGFTTVLTAIAAVQCGQVYHIKMAIGDASDGIYDSWVYLEAGSFQSNQLAAAYTAPNLAPANGGMYEGCDPANLTFTRAGQMDVEVTYDLVISGAAINGVDFEALPSQVVFAPGISSVSIPLVAIQDGILEGTETFNVMIMDNACGNSNTNIDIAISDLPNLVVTISDVIINCGQQAVMTPSVSGGIGNYHLTWENGFVGATYATYPSAPTSYNFTVTDTCGVATFNGAANVTFVDNPPLTVSIGPDISATCIDQINISAIVAGGFGTYGYNWTGNAGSIAATSSISFVSSTDAVIEVTVTDDCNETATDQLQLVYPPNPVSVDVGNDLTVSCLDENTIVPVVSGGVGTLSYSWYSVFANLGSANDLVLQAASNMTVTLTVEDECGNSNSDSFAVNVPPVPVNVNLGNDQSVTCIDEVVLVPTVSGGVGTYSYNWSDQSGTLGSANQITYSTAVNESVVLTVTDECGNSNTDEVAFSIQQIAINVNVGNDLTVQCIDNVELDGTINGGIGNFTYNWTIDGVYVGNQSTLSQQFDQLSSVVLTVEDECGNTASDALNVNVPPVPVAVDAVETMVTTCLVAVNPLGEASGGVGSYSYVWSDASGWTFPGISATYNASENTTLTLTVTDQCGNSDSDIVSVLVPPVPVVLTTSEDITICINESTTLVGVADGGVGTITTEWVGFGSDLLSIDVTPEETTSYVFRAYDQCGNESTHAVQVGVMQVTPNFKAEYIDDFTVAFTNLTPESNVIMWEFGDGTYSSEINPVHTYTSLEDWTVQLTAWAAPGCSRSIEQEYFPVGNLFVPNCFTPDKDGVNEVFFVKGHDLKSYKIEIFNKWGEPLYISDDITKPWDGSVRGGDYYAPDGVYPFVIKAEDERGNFIEKKGSVLILR
jgi:gliding motility-associated-like protein